MVTAKAKRLVVIAIAVALVAAVSAALALGDGDDEGIGTAVDLAEDAARFDSSAEAGDTFALIAGELLNDARACVAERSPEDPRCIALSEAAAYVQTVAVAAVRCTAPGVFEMRERTLEHLRAIERMDGEARPPIAEVPSCF